MGELFFAVLALGDQRDNLRDLLVVGFACWVTCVTYVAVRVLARSGRRSR